MTALQTSSHLLFPELFRDDALRLESPRLWLRWPTRADAPRLHEIASLEAVARQTATWPHPLPNGEAERRIEKARVGNASGSDVVLALTEKRRPATLIGIVGVGVQLTGARDADGTLVLGYMMSVEHQGYGLTTEAVRTLVGAVFRFSQFDRIRGASQVANIASRRVMEKAGFRHLGQRENPVPTRQAPISCDELELTRAMWLGRPCLQATASKVVAQACAA